jgi:hypothetical protein
MKSSWAIRCVSWLKMTDILGTISVPSLGSDVCDIRSKPSHLFTSFLGLILFLDWYSSMMLDRISQQIPGLTEIETSIPVKVSGVKPDFDSFYYYVVHVFGCFI